MYYGKTRATRKWLLSEAAKKRLHMTPAERVLWEWLKIKKADWKSQYVKLQYILDFYNPFICMGIEADGGYHNQPHVVTKDRMRDSHLLEDGTYVLHVTNEAIFDGSAMPVIHRKVLRMVELKFRYGPLLSYHLRTDAALRYSEGI
jgi:very-short-patch-repair endonuclease